MSDASQRSLLWVVAMILLVHALLLAALIAVAMRVTVISITLPERVPARKTSFEFRGVVPAKLKPGVGVHKTPAAVNLGGGRV